MNAVIIISEGEWDANVEDLTKNNEAVNFPRSLVEVILGGPFP